MGTQQHPDRSNQTENKEEEQGRLAQTLENIRYALMVMSGKVAVEMSSLAANLAAALVKNGHYGGLLDADIYGPDTPKMFGFDWSPLEGGDNGM